MNRITPESIFETASIDTNIVKIKRFIFLQKEFRTALISEMVTGKIKVTQEVIL